MDWQVTQVQFQKAQLVLTGIGGAGIVAVSVLADPGCSGEEGKFQGQPRPGPGSFDCVWLEMGIGKSLRRRSNRSSKFWQG